MNSNNEEEFIEGVIDLYLDEQYPLQLTLVVTAGSDNLVRRFAEHDFVGVILSSSSCPEDRMRQIIRAIGDGEATYRKFAKYLDSYEVHHEDDDTLRKILKVIRDENSLDIQLQGSRTLDKLYPTGV